MENKKYLFADGAGYLMLNLLALLQLGVGIYSLSSDLPRFVSSGAVQISALLDSAVLIVSLFIESNMLILCRGKIFVYAINRAFAMPHTEDNINAVLRQQRPIYEPDSTCKFASKPKSAKMRTLFFVVVAIITAIEFGAGIFSLMNESENSLRDAFAIALLSLDFVYIINRLLSRGCLRYFWCTFDSTRANILAEEIGQDDVSLERLSMFVFATLWAMATIGTMLL